jgi:hypothetical protein
LVAGSCSAVMDLALRVFVWRLSCLAQALAARLATARAGASDQAARGSVGAFLGKAGCLAASVFERAVRRLRRAVAPAAQ